MRAAAALSLFLVCAPAAAFAQDERPTRTVPGLPKAPRFQGGHKGLASPLVLKPAPTEGASASFSAKVGLHKDTLYVGVEATDNQLGAVDLITLSLFFPGAGPTATGYTWRFAFDGKRASGADDGAAAFGREAGGARPGGGHRDRCRGDRGGLDAGGRCP